MPPSLTVLRDRFGPRRGFALLLTLTLLSFIVLLIVGLATYSRVETAVAGNVRRQAEARENALLGLNIALGQLQKYAGVDTVVTATAEGQTGVDPQKRYYTGVWSSAPYPLPTDPEAPPPQESKPLIWLASGADTAAVEEVSASIPPAERVPLVGLMTDGAVSANATSVRAIDIKAPGVPGVTGNATIGRYAWWVGDQGVKAPVAVPIPADAVSHQFSQGAPGVADTGTVVFDPWDGSNPASVDDRRILTVSQLAFLHNNNATTLVGSPTVRRNYHAWTTNNFGVIADTRRGGLRQDLSLDPSLLGETFRAWTNYPDPLYTEMPPQPVVPPIDPADPAAPTLPPPVVYDGPSIFPEYEEGFSLRRRYWITPQIGSDGVLHSVAPVLNFFGITISVHEDPNNPNFIEVSARCGVGLWNPYTGALLPEDLKIEIQGLPEIEVYHAQAPRPVSLNTMDLLSDGTGTLTFKLPWVNTQGVSDTHSWLPGRVYNWASVGNAAPSTEGNEMAFHQPDLTSMTGPFDITRTPGLRFVLDPTSVELPNRWCSLIAPNPVELTVKVRRASDDVVLGEYKSPPFYFPTPSAPLDFKEKCVDFGFVFRLPDLNDGIVTGTPVRWLTTRGADPRESILPADAFTYGAQGSSATLYGGLTVYGFDAASSGRLLEREATAQTFDKDVPVFELPRAVFVSVGGLQHLHLAGARPFAIGNSWGVESEVKNMRANSLFDRFFFSGLTEQVSPGTTTQGDILLPNFLLKPLRKADQTKVTAAEIRATYMTPAVPAVPATDTTPEVPEVPAMPAAAASRSSKFFLQSGAFNLNSTSVAAWASVLSSMRIPGGRGLNYLNASELTGSEADSITLPLSSAAPHFFRFAQSAAETFRTGEDPAAARTSYFRKGVREISAEHVGALAAKIVEFVTKKHAAPDSAGGPFRSIEEFLNPSALFAGVGVDGNALAPRGLLEAAIEDANLNFGVPEFSSQWLTQADIMSALAPTLFARSDTFVIRAYGEAVNPVVVDSQGRPVVEGRAWCEAVVQRLPEYFADPVNFPPDALGGAFEPAPNPDTPDIIPEPTEAQKLNKALGRRFKVVSFRWLTRADI